MVVVSWARWGNKGGGNTATNNSKHKQAQTKNNKKITKSRTTSGSPGWGWVTTTANNSKHKQAKLCS